MRKFLPLLGIELNIKEQLNTYIFKYVTYSMESHDSFAFIPFTGFVGRDAYKDEQITSHMQVGGEATVG